MNKRSTFGWLISVALVWGLFVTGAGSGARAAQPPYEPDPNADGTLKFFDEAGAVVTSGNVDDAPFAAYVQATAAGRQGDTKATLFGYVPKKGQDTGAFAGESLTASQNYPNASAPGALGSSPLPIVALDDADTTLEDLASDFPNDATDEFEGLYQLRIKTSGPGQPAGSRYSATTIQIDGNTWTQVYPVPTSTPTTTTPPTTGAPGSTTTTVKPATTTTVKPTTTTAKPATTTTTVHPSTTTTTVAPGTTTTTVRASTTTTAPSGGATTTTTTTTAPTASITVKTSSGSTLSGGSVLAPGTRLSLSASGFSPGETVSAVVRSTPVTVGSATANSAGVVTLDITLPSSLAAGAHTITLQGSVTRTFAFSVASALPRTGGEPWAPLRVGVLLLVLGGTAVHSARRRVAHPLLVNKGRQ